MTPTIHITSAVPAITEVGVEGEGKGGAFLTYLCLTSLAVAAVAGLGNRMQVEEMPAQRGLLPLPVIVGGETRLRVAGFGVCTEAASYRDEFFAYLMFDYLRRPFHGQGLQLTLVFDNAEQPALYRLVACGERDMLAAISSMTGITVGGLALTGDWQLLSKSRIAGMSEQTKVFIAAYNLPVREKLEQLPSGAVARYLQRFIRFKSATDPRIRRRLEPIPAALSADEAQRLAGDIITVAGFFELPLDFFLGVGAMENNYMNVRGDLQHTIWKRHPAPDDIVLERKRGRVRVLNDSAGVWQITRETLRYAHRLYMNDERDYSLLPEHLRPPEKLIVGEVDPNVLTTYAGLLLRDLLDRFDGDVTLAVSAYNGGPARPNLKYGRGVQNAALHARRALEQAAVLNGESVMQRQWLR